VKRKKSVKDKIIITGPGRAGTSFLVMLLTRIGFDTGFKPYQETFDEKVRAGCEKSLFLDGDFKEDKKKIEKAPRILKAPDYSFVLKNFCQSGIMKISHVIIPIRDFKESVKSRLNVGLRWSLEDDEGAEEQERIIAEALGRAIEACVICKIPCTILVFPDLVKNCDYLYSQLNPIFHIDSRIFREKFEELAESKKKSKRRR